VKPVAWYCPCDPDLHTAFRWHFDYVDRSNEHCEMCGKLLIALHPADQLREVEQQRDELLAALESALEIVEHDRCDGATRHLRME